MAISKPTNFHSWEGLKIPDKDAFYPVIYDSRGQLDEQELTEAIHTLFRSVYELAEKVEPTPEEEEDKFSSLYFDGSVRSYYLGEATFKLTTPTNLQAEGGNEMIILSWDHDIDEDEFEELESYVLYYAKSSFSNPADATRKILGSKATSYIFARELLNFQNILDRDTYYFRVSAMNVAEEESGLSNEASAAVGSGGKPSDTVPVPICDIELYSKSYGLNCIARRPQTHPNLLLTKANFEIYQAPDGLGNPTAGSPDGNQTLIDTHDDDSAADGFRRWIALNDKLAAETISTVYGDYWFRARFTDTNSLTGNWGLSGILTFDEETDTPDTGIVDVSDLAFDQDVQEVFFTVFGLHCTVLIGMGVTPGADGEESAYQVEYEHRGALDVSDPTVSFVPATGFSATTEPHGNRVLSGCPTGVEITFLSSEAVDFTFRVRNTYGWSNWMTPVRLTLSNNLGQNADTDVPTLTDFRLYTKANPPADGEILDGNEIAIDVLFGANNNTTFMLDLEGDENGTWPTESQFADQTDGTLTATRGGYTLAVTGWTGSLVTANSLVGKDLRMGREGAANTESNILSEAGITANTAESGGAFTITVGQKVRNSGAQTYWEIVDAAIHELVDFAKYDIPVDFSGAPWNYPGTTYSSIPRIKLKLHGPVDYYFRIRARNIKGRSVYYYATTGTASTIQGNQALKSLLGVAGVDMATGNTYGVGSDNLKDEAVTPQKTVRDLQPIGHSINFTSTDYNSFSWGAGSVYFKYGTALSINSGSATSLTGNEVYWVYATLGSATLTATTSVTSATGSNKIIVALVKTTYGAEDSQSCTIISRWGETPATVAGGHVVCDTLAAITADVGELTAGTITGLLIRTAASGARIELDSGGFEAIDSGGNTRIEIPTAADQLYFRDSAETIRAKLEGYGTSPNDGLRLIADTLLIDDNSGHVIALRPDDAKITFGPGLYNDFKIYNSSSGAVLFRNAGDSSTILSMGATGQTNIAVFGATPQTQDTGWSVSSYSSDKTITGASTLDEVADCLCTLIDSLKAYGWLGA